MAQTFDVIVIGAGPAGYISAVRAAQLGMKTACVEEWKTPQGVGTLGGTCLNTGCIPSKALLESSENFERVQHKFESHGITIGGAKMDVAKMMARKDSIVLKMTKGIEFLFKKNKITWLKGHGNLVGKGATGWQVEVSGDGATEIAEGKAIIIATGSKARHLPGLLVDNEIVCDNVGALTFKEVPKRLGVIGAGVIGLELGSVWKRLGAEVTILEALPDFLAAADAEVAKVAAREFKKQGLDIRLGAKVSKADVKKDGVHLTYADGKGEQSMVVDKLLVAVGRRAATRNLLADGTGVKLDARGMVEVDEHCFTGVEGIWAVGDCVRGPMLAHKGFEEGIAVAELIAGLPGHVNLDTVPWVIYTEPEIAWVGKTEQQLKAEGIPYKTGSFPFAAVARAVAMGEPAGFVKVIAHEETDRILGMHLVGVGVSELVHEGVMAMEFHGSAEDLARICHAHPTLSEAIHDAAMAVDKRAIHKAN
jgi:dihydrolipoamide dehydrogenase